MGVIVPAILPTSKHDLEDKLGRLIGMTDSVQIDIVDGKFVSPATWPYTEGESGMPEGDTIPHLADFRIEIDFMGTDPDAHAGSWIDAGASRIVIHAESTRFLARTMEELEHRFGHDQGFVPEMLSFGLALNPSSDMALIEPYLHFVEYVQFMGIRAIGRQGEPFDSSVVDHVRTLKRKYPELKVQVDGGVNRASAPALLDAGVDRLIVGSALWRADDVAEEYRALTALTQMYGLYE